METTCADKPEACPTERRAVVNAHLFKLLLLLHSELIEHGQRLEIVVLQISGGVGLFSNAHEDAVALVQLANLPVLLGFFELWGRRSHLA